MPATFFFLSTAQTFSSRCHYRHTVSRVPVNGIRRTQKHIINTHKFLMTFPDRCVFMALTFFIFLRSYQIIFRLLLSPPPLSRKLCADHYTIILLTNDTNLPRVLSVAFFSLIRGSHAWHHELVALLLNIVHKMSPCVVFGSPDANIMCKWEQIINNIWQGLCDTCSELSMRTTGHD